MPLFLNALAFFRTPPKKKRNLLSAVSLIIKFTCQRFQDKLWCSNVFSANYEVFAFRKQGFGLVFLVMSLSPTFRDLTTFHPYACWSQVWDLYIWNTKFYQKQTSSLVKTCSVKKKISCSSPNQTKPNQSNQPTNQLSHPIWLVANPRCARATCRCRASRRREWSKSLGRRVKTPCQAFLDELGQNWKFAGNHGDVFGICSPSHIFFLATSVFWMFFSCVNRSFWKRQLW